MTATAPDRDADMLAELAEMDLSAAKHVHAQLLAATGADEVADLSRSYQRASRCLRQTLALKARLAKDAVVHRTRTSTPPFTEWAAQVQAFARDDELDDRITRLQDAVGRVIYTEASDAGTRADVTERLDLELDDWMTRPDFTTADLDDQVLRACRTLGLSENTARRWRELPKATDDPSGQDVEDIDEAMPGETCPDRLFTGDGDGVGDDALTRTSGRVDTG